MQEKSNILLIGIGNSGRADDGLGWAFIDAIKNELPDNYDTEYRYQLQIEDAELITHYDAVIFVDAHKGTFDRGFTWEACIPKTTGSFTSHQLAPETVLYLAASVYNKRPRSFVLGIGGVSFCLDIGLSMSAEKNLSRALDFFSEKGKESFEALAN